jgi:ribosomal protein S18 acetylase RimI-like enzyme
MSQPPNDTTTILQALEQNLWSYWSRFGRGEGCALHDEHGALRFETPVPLLPYNFVIRFSRTEGVDEHLDRLFEAYRRRRVPFLWLVHPSARPHDLDLRLSQRGFREVEVLHGMWMMLDHLPAEPAVPEGFELRQVQSASDLDGLLDLVSWRWEVPAEHQAQLARMAAAFDLGAPTSAVRCWIAWQDGRPVSKLVMNCDAGSAGIFAVATRPEVRGRGLARALTIKALAAAHRDGYRIGILHSSDMAKRLYEDIGFRLLAPFRVFSLPNSFHA